MVARRKHTEQTSEHLGARRPNGLSLVRSGGGNVYLPLLPPLPSPTVPAEQRQAIYRLRCKYSFQVRKAPPPMGGQVGTVSRYMGE
ncbi:unnamed protein product [Danaus chrysippus]|uniref:(African queen) hypothetical protein n=1 Tax=Danaus chrysippus TaxID=151541 RepID=A0A8J2R8V3_9NEOP|nr:unnamed protein product [Danaus chrysippus]